MVVFTWRPNKLLSVSPSEILSPLILYIALRSNQSTSWFSHWLKSLSVLVWQAKKTKGNEVVSTPQEAATKPDENSLPTPPSDQAAATDGSKTDVAADGKQGRVQRRYRKRHAVPVEKPPEGSIMTELDQIKYAFVHPTTSNILLLIGLALFNPTFPKLFSGRRGHILSYLDFYTFCYLL